MYKMHTHRLVINKPQVASWYPVTSDHPLITAGLITSHQMSSGHTVYHITLSTTKGAKQYVHTLFDEGLERWGRGSYHSPLFPHMLAVSSCEAHIAVSELMLVAALVCICASCDRTKSQLQA